MGRQMIIAFRLSDSTRGLGYHARAFPARRRWYRVVPHAPIMGCRVTPPTEGCLTDRGASRAGRAKGGLP